MINVNESKLKELLESLGQHLELSHFGWSSLTTPISIDVYKDWIDQGLHGQMGYLSDHFQIKNDSKQKWPEANSAIVFAVPYFPHPEPVNLPIKQARLSLYSQGYDYHHWFKLRMTQIIDQLKSEFPNDFFIAVTDSSPILERDLAYRAGLGWIGKNTCLIHPKKGSLFFLGEILTSLKLTKFQDPIHDFCGTCNRCAEACPTGALVSPKKMDARKCIAYLTIESREIPAPELRPQIGDWLFGCDICQTVCPWNQKIFKGLLETEKTLTLNSDEEGQLETDLKYLLSASGKQLERDFKGTAYSRAGSFGLKRNALIVIANRKVKNLKTEVEKWIEHPKLGPLALWTLDQLK